MKELILIVAQKKEEEERHTARTHMHNISA